MRFEIRHRTTYRYSGNVRLDRHTLRVLPRSDARQRPLCVQIDVHPPPTQRVDFVDDWGNPASQLWFEGETRRFEIDARLAVETRRSHAPAPTAFPLDYGSELEALQPYLAPLAEDDVMADFTADALERSDGRATALLDRINERVHGFYAHGLRLEGPPRAPAETLRRGEGVCRDLALLFMSACRHLGIAARFVSGYQEKPATPGHDRRYLHAWAEVHLPRSGWHGYDPTHGARVESRHVAVACAPDPSATAPIEGSFRFAGTPPTSTLETEILVARRPPEP